MFVNGVTTAYGFRELDDQSLNMLSGNSLPLALPPLSSLSFVGPPFNGYAGGDLFSADGTPLLAWSIDSEAPAVPEPATLGLLASGLAALAARRRRR